MSCFSHFAIALLIAILPNSLWAQESPRPEGNEAVYQHAAVAADHPLASQAGLEILRQGGNVVDAAVATSFALSVVRPESCGIGGGGFMVIWNAQTKKAVALDYREVAPKAASREMYLDARKSNPKNPVPSQNGALAVAVPGHVAGLCYALETYGTMDLRAVLAPSLRYCKEGVPVDAFMRSTQKTMLARFQEHPEYKTEYAALWKHYLNEGTPWPKDARFHSPLGPVYEKIAQEGQAGFYAGEVGSAIVKAMKDAGGIITAEDLKSIAPKERAVLRGKYLGREILTMPPPSSGGVALLEILNVLAAWEETHPPKPGELAHNQADTLQLLTEAMKHAYADRAEYLGDPDFVKVPVDRLTSSAYAAKLAERISLKETKPLESYGRVMPVSDAGTSHYSVMDAQGNAVACTETVNTTFGSLFVEPKFGIVLNNEMDDFAAIPGEPNAFGLIQSEANAVQPGKRPLSSMTPTIVLKDDKANLALGGSGGPRIISSTLQVLLNVMRFEMPPGEAIAKPRIHHQWLPNVLYMEDPLLETMQTSLEQRGHKVERRNNLAVVQTIQRTAKGIKAASDPRKHGKPAGY
jgi:gamma-glutamyltranspeptidase/glutathione hydrolase